MRNTHPAELKTVYIGPRECVTILEGRLAAEGIPTFVAEHGGLLDIGAFDFGWSLPCHALQVPAAMAAHAQTIADIEFPPKPTAPLKSGYTRAFLFLALAVLVVFLLTESWLL